MWLLSTDRAELEYFVSSEKAAEAEYAILSHFWNKTEQSFQETQALRAKCAANGTNPRDFSSDKTSTHEGTVSQAYNPEKYIFAPSPASSTRYSEKRALYDPNIQLLNFSDEPLKGSNPSSQTANVHAFTITPHGVRARLPVVHINNGVASAALFVRHVWAYSVLLLLSRFRDSVCADHPLYHTSALHWRENERQVTRPVG
ncbi:hypothetical protein C8Q80DRAFT_1266832 [Daedaleopsis nitida]|nr:hypothetical protein C8Q80DRAFT_1266832 [Daedaleopsis nitida]